jgi:hypothetical protein
LRVELPSVELSENEYKWGGKDKVHTINSRNDNLKAGMNVENVKVDGETLYKLLGPSARIRWSKNLAHNLIQKLYLSFNELNAVEMNHHWLDFWSEFMLPTEKTKNYNDMIGNTDKWNNPMKYYETNLANDYEKFRFGYAAPGGVLTLPVPLPFSKDTGNALPCAAIPYNEIRLHTIFKNRYDVLLVDYPYGSHYGSSYQGALNSKTKDELDKNLGNVLYQLWIGKLEYSADVLRDRIDELFTKKEIDDPKYKELRDWVSNYALEDTKEADLKTVNTIRENIMSPQASLDSETTLPLSGTASFDEVLDKIRKIGRNDIAPVPASMPNPSMSTKFSAKEWDSVLSKKNITIVENPSVYVPDDV